MKHYKLVIGKFMPPHMGHDYLIRFADAFRIDSSYSFQSIYDTKTLVIVCGMDSEPIDSSMRFDAMNEHYFGSGILISHLFKTMPQEPKDDPDFWDKWKSAIEEIAERNGLSGTPYVFASEPYGMKLAEVLNGHFIPVDVDRSIVPTSGTDIRNNMLKPINWNKIIPEFRRRMQINVHIIGSESTGKTTLSRDIRETFDIMINGFNSSAGSVMTVVPEYARGYLREYGDSNLSEQTWNDLFRSGITQLRTNIDSAIIVRDTSLITTVGWATILNPDYMAVTTNDRIEQLSMVDQTIRNTRNDLYFLLPDDVPFEVDPQRYGIYKRQSTKEFWKTLLDKYGISPIVVPDENSSRPGPKYGSLYKKTNFMIYHILKKFESNLKTT